MTSRPIFRLAAGVLLGTVLVAVVGRVWAQLPKQSPTDGQIIRAVKGALELHHLVAHRVDDEVSKRFFATFLKEFDPAKVYFEKADIEEFKAHELALDDEIVEGKVEFAYQVLERFLARAKERAPLVEELINSPHDFSVDEYLDTDYDNLDYAATPDELRERWRRRVKFDLLMQRLEKNPKPEAEQKQRILKRYRTILRRWEQTSSDELLEMYVNALTTSFDPHTQYMSATTLEDFNISMRLHLEGIGARLRWEDGYTIVAEIVKGGAADRDGRLHVEDKITGVASDGVHLEDVIDMKLTDVVQRIRGKAGTTVVLRVIPAGKSEPVEYKLTRAKVELTESRARGEVIETGKKEDGTPYRVGYIDLPSFYMDVFAAGVGRNDARSSTRDVAELIRSFNDAGGVDGVILDLRHNGGGALREAVDLVGLFIDRGGVVQVKEPGAAPETLSDSRGTLYAGPLLVLVSKLSASASEIFAGAIQDYGRGLIVGDMSTHGKGTVQQMVDTGRLLDRGGNPGDLGALKLTIQQFYRVNGDSTQARGVVSDVVLPSRFDYMEIGEANLPHALPFDRVDAVEHANLGLITADLKKQIQELSDRRRETSEDFRKLAHDIDRLKELKKRKTVSLNEEKRREEIGRGEEEEDELAELDRPKKPDAPTFERSFYNNEVLSIMEDFLRLGGHPRVAAKS